TRQPSPQGRGMPGGVVLLNAEDDLSDTIRPRLEAAGADLSRITAGTMTRVQNPTTGATVERGFCLAGDLPGLERLIRRVPDCRLLVIDPITAYLGDTDSHNNAEVRGLLAPLSELAARHKIAVVAVT